MPIREMNAKERREGSLGKEMMIMTSVEKIL